MNKFPTLTAIVLGGMLLVIAVLVTRLSKAESKRGLYLEQNVNADGVSLRRVRDTSDGTVCYVAKGPPVSGYAGHAFSVAISCVKERP